MTDVEMSSDELRAQLYTSLRGKGILDSLKSQLRTKLATELQKSLGTVSSQGAARKVSKSKATGQTHCAMSIQVANSVVAEHMKRAGFEYSLSVFLPEAELSMDKLFTSDDLLHFLQVPPSSPLAKSLQTSPSEHGFLVQLLEATLKANSTSTAKSGSQREPLQSEEADESQSEGSAGEDSPVKSGFRKTSVATQLQALENAYARKAEEETQKYQKSLEDRLSEYQRDLEARYKSQLETEMSLFRSRELAKAQLEEREKYQREILREKEEAQLKHQQKMDDLRRSELRMKERYSRKEQELEASIFSQRQALLAELDSLKVREADAKRRTELDKQMLAVERERIKVKEEELVAREALMERNANEKVKKFQMEMDSKFQLKERELMKRESECTMDRGRLANTQSEQQLVATELMEERKKGERTQQLLQEATDRQIALENQKETLQQQIDQMKDYQQLKKKIAELQQSAAMADKKLTDTKTEYKRRLSEQKQLLKQLQLRQAGPIAELTSLQEQLEQLRKQHHHEMRVMEYDNQSLEKQLSEQTEYSVQLQRQLDEQLLQLKSAQREVEDLHSLVEQMKPLSLRSNAKSPTSASRKRAEGTVKRSNQSQKKPTLSFSIRQPEPTSVELHPKQPHHTFTPFTTSTAHPRRMSDDVAALLAIGLPASSTTGTFDKQHAHQSFADRSGDFLADTRASFARLEREAKELERTYQSFHHRNGHTQSPQILEDVEPLLPFHRMSINEQGSSPSSCTASPELPFSPTTTTTHIRASTRLPQPMSAFTVGSPPPPASAPSTSATTTTTTSSSPVLTSTHLTTSTSTHLTSGTQQQQHLPSSTTNSQTTRSSTLEPSSLATAVVTRSLTTALVDTAPLSPPLLTDKNTSAKPPSLVPSQTTKPSEPLLSQAKKHSDVVPGKKEASAKAGQRLSLDDWWKSSASSSVLSNQPSTKAQGQAPPQSHVPPLPQTASLPQAAASLQSEKTKAATKVDTIIPGQSTDTEDKPKIMLDDLWKSSSLTSGSNVIGGEIKATKSSDLSKRKSQSPPPVNLFEKPKVSLDALWKSPSHSQTPASSSTQTTASTSERLREEREEREKVRRQQQLEEEEKVRKELEELQMQEERKKVQAQSLGQSTRLNTETVEEKVSLKTASEKSETERDKDKKTVTSDNEGIDPVMLKYMELVKEKREKQKPGKGESHFPPVSEAKDSPSEKDYGVPSLSQATDSFGGFSDHENEGDPFEDW